MREDQEKDGLTKKALEEIKLQVHKIAANLEQAQISDFLQLLNNPGRLLVLNLISGVARGIGIAVGFTIFAGTILYLLQFLGALNLPIIGGYIAEIVKIVQAQLEGGRRF